MGSKLPWDRRGPRETLAHLGSGGKMPGPCAGQELGCCTPRDSRVQQPRAQRVLTQRHPPPRTIYSF